MRKILIGTPLASAAVTIPYFESVRRLEQDLHGERCFDFSFPQSSLLMFSRNALANAVIRNAEYSHLLFIDADMGFSTSLIQKMLVFNKPIVGCVAPARHFNLDRFHAAARAQPQADDASIAAQTYLVDDEALAQVGSFQRVRYTGTGIMLIQRSALIAMSEQIPSLWSSSKGSPYDAFGLDGRIFQCFTPVRNEDNVYFAEDVSFCLRWTSKCSGEIWVCVDETIIHVGQHSFAGNYSKAMLLDRPVG